MHRIAIILATAFVALLSTLPARAELRVVATVPTLAAIAKEIGGSHATVASLSLPTQDPHFVDPKPSLALKLNKADLLLTVGLGLESGWLPTLLTGARNAAVQPGSRGHLDASTLVQLMDRGQHADRSQGDIHPGGNPHYLYDPRQLVQVAIGVAARMGELDRDHADAYNANLAAFLKRLHETRRALEKKLQAHRGAAIVSYHRSWTYLTDWLGLREVAYLEPKPGIPPTPAHVARVIASAKKEGAKIILQESYYPNRTGSLVASKAGATLVTLPAGVDVDRGQTVDGYLKALADRIEGGFSQ